MQYVVVDHEVRTYRMWFADHSVQSFSSLLAEHGLRVEQVWGALTGGPVDEASGWFAVRAVSDT